MVIVPGIGRTQRSDREPLLNWLELPGTGGESELLLSPISAAGARSARSLAEYIRRLRKQRSRLERARVLYVAATRARRQLHWFGAAPAPRDGELAARADTMLGILWPTIGADFRQAHAAAAALTAAAAAPPAAAPSRWRLPADWAPQAALPGVHAARLALSVRESERGARVLLGGTHRARRGYDRARGVAAPRAAGARCPRPRTPARMPTAVGWPNWASCRASAPAAGERIHAALAQTLRDPRGRWLLGNAHREAHCEWRLTGLHQGRIVNVIIDRLLVDAHGERWLVDYKTSVHEGERSRRVSGAGSRALSAATATLRRAGEQRRARSGEGGLVFSAAG